MVSKRHHLFTLSIFILFFPPNFQGFWGFFFAHSATDMIKKTGAGAECPQPRHSTLTAVCRSAFKHQIRNSRQRSVMEKLAAAKDGWAPACLHCHHPDPDKHHRVECQRAAQQKRAGRSLEKQKRSRASGEAPAASGQRDFCLC